MPRSALVAASVFVVVTAGAASCTPHARPQAPACAAAVQCYFSATPDHALGLIAGFEALSDRDLFVRTYGATGTCWTDDDALAHACEDRCRGLLSQDCSQPYVTSTAGIPFCRDTDDAGVLLACAFPEECSDPGSHVNGVAVSSPSLCPAPDDLCSAPANDAAKAPATTGCCVIPDDGSADRQHPPVDAGCAYTYQ